MPVWPQRGHLRLLLIMDSESMFRGGHMPVLCPLCVSDEHTSTGVADDGRRYVLCVNTREHGEDGFAWEPTPPRQTRIRGDGLGTELDIWDKLLECLPADGAPHSYGDVEDAFFDRYPADAALLQARYGHRWREGKRSTQYSMSAYLAARLRDLANEKAVELTWGPAEGHWSYNGIISYWARGDAD